MLIDALRADFVLDRDALRDAGVDYGPGYAERPKIAFLEAAIAEKRAEARAVVAKATPPTVTLPRIKVVIESTVKIINGCSLLSTRTGYELILWQLALNTLTLSPVRLISRRSENVIISYYFSINCHRP